jgi:putative nucleotidyltransferase with HDIG domain
LSSGGRAYVGCVILAGGAAIAQASFDLYRHPLDWQWFILAGLTLLSGSITVKVPSIPATISVSETFVFTAVMLFGPSAGTITVALDGLIISLWLQRKKREAYKALFNVAAPSVSLWASAQLYFALSGSVPLASAPQLPVSNVLFALGAFTLAYFLLNSSLIAIAISLEKATSALKVWRENFVWLSLNFFSGASVAALLVAYTRRLDTIAVGLIIPLLIISYLTYKTSMGRLEDTTNHLKKLNELYLSTIETLALWIDAKDQVTHGHIRRVQTCAVDLARELGVKDEKLIGAIQAAALLHDMGKLAVPEHILNKPGKLTPGEFDKMKSHASVGAQILSSIDFPYPVVPIVRHHHENWDGTGYPDSLAGTDIPIGARILAVVDCFDALTSDRPYRPRLQDEEALKMLTLRRGSMYDPLVVDAFLHIHRGGQTSPKTVASDPPALAETVINATRSRSAEQQPGASEPQRVWIDLRGEMGKKLLQLGRQAMPVSLGIMYYYEGQTDTLTVAHAAGDGAEKVARLKIKVGQGVSGWVAANRRTMANSDSFLDLGDDFHSGGAPLKSCLSLPILLGDSLLGVLSLYSTEPNRFSHGHKDLLESHVRQFVNDLGSRANTLDEMPIDEDQLGAISTQVFMRGELYGQHVGILLLNVAPQAAMSEIVTQELLCLVDRCIRESVRVTDLSIRTREDEILVVLAQTDAATARATAGRIAHAVGQTVFELSNGMSARLAVQYGLAISPDDGSSFGSLLGRARRDAERKVTPSTTVLPTVH